MSTIGTGGNSKSSGKVTTSISGGGANTGGAVVMGLGFNYGSFDLDMNLNSYGTMLNDPVKYVTGRNNAALGAGWTITYNW